MSEIILYHGSPKKTIVPTFGLGNEKHDYGKGFYLTDRIDLAKEWAYVFRMQRMGGYIHMNWNWMALPYSISRKTTFFPGLQN